MAKDIEIGGRLHSIATGNIVSGANEVFDDTEEKRQSEINEESARIGSEYGEAIIPEIGAGDALLTKPQILTDKQQEDVLANINNKEYNSTTYGGMGRVFLKKNMIFTGYHFEGFVNGITVETSSLAGTPDAIVFDNDRLQFLAVKNQTLMPSKYYMTWSDETSSVYINPSESDIFICDSDNKAYWWDGNSLALKIDGEKTNVLTQELMPVANTIYIIQYDFTLGEDITVPANCVLEFDGGSISAGNGENKDTITGQNTSINAGLVEIFNTDIILAGSWNIKGLYPEWFGAKGNGVNDDSGVLQKIANIDIPLFLSPTKIYNVTKTIEIYRSVYGNEATIQLDNSVSSIVDVIHINKPGLAEPFIIRDLYVEGNSNLHIGTGINVDGAHCILDNVKVHNFNIGIKVKKWSISIMNCHSNYNNINMSIYSSGEGGNIALINDINVIGGNYSSPIQGWAIKIGDINQDDSNTSDINGYRILLQGFCFDAGSISIENVKDVTLDNLYGENPKVEFSNIELSNFGENKVTNIEIRNCYLRGGVYGIYINNKTSNINIHNNHFSRIKYCLVYSKNNTRLTYLNNNYDNSSGYPLVHTGISDNPNKVEETDSYYYFGDKLINAEGGTLPVNPANRIQVSSVFIVNSKGYQIRYSGRYGHYPLTPVTEVTATKGSGTRDFILSTEDIKKFNGGDSIKLAGRNGFIKHIDYPNNTIYVYGNDFPSGGTINHNLPLITTTLLNVPESGTFANKPSVANYDIPIGFRYFCTDKQTTEGATDGIEIIHKGNDVWIDALGRVVS